MELQDVDSHFEYRLRDNGYLVSYDVSAMLNDAATGDYLVYDLTDYRVTEAVSPYETKVLKFDKDGIADKYIWKLYRRSNPSLFDYVKIEEIETYNNEFVYTYDTNFYSFNLFKVECTILNNGYSVSFEK
jgi:hypothetical protein